MTYTWFKIFNMTDFMALQLVQKTYTFIFEGVGQKDVLVTRGNLVSVIYEGTLLPLGLNDRNPFVHEPESESDPQMAVYQDENDDVYLGFLNET